MDYLFRMTIETKEDVTGEGAAPELPDGDAAAQYLTDHLNDLTKHDGMTGWRITRVRPA